AGVEGELIKWLAAEVETVVEDQPVVEVMTDKVTVELPSPYAGVLQKHLAAEGDVVHVNQAIALFADDGAATAQSPAATPAATPSATQEAAQSGVNVQAAEERSIVESGTQEPVDDGDSLSLFKPGDKGEDGPLYTIKRPTGGRSDA